MSKNRFRQIINDLRSGMDETELMWRHGLSPKRLQKLVQTIADEDATEHNDLYEKSPTYRSVADLLASRRSHRVRIPTAIRVYDKATYQHGLLRDVSESGIRVAGISANIGELRTLSIRLEEVGQAQALEFEAVCRWSREKGSGRKYLVSGFEIINLSGDLRSRLRDLIELLGSQGQEKDWTLSDRLPITELSPSTVGTPPTMGSREFSGKIHGVDVLDFVQFVMLTGKKTIIQIRSSDGKEGHLYLDRGKVLHAVQGDLRGPEAFFACMNFPGGEFLARDWGDPVEHTIEEHGDFMIFEAARRRDELTWEALSEQDQCAQPPVIERGHPPP